MSQRSQTDKIVQFSGHQIHHLDIYQPTSNLPPELLLEIFSVILDEWHSQLLWNNRRLAALYGPAMMAAHIPPNVLLPITHVCQYWRNVAVHAPTLWTHVTLNDSLDTMLNRSQRLPISLYWNIQHDGSSYSQEEQLQIRDRLRPHLHRVQLLQITSEDDLHVSPQFLLSCHLPSIQDITLTTMNDHRLLIARELFRVWMKPDYDGLRRLSVAHVYLPCIRAAIRPSLRHLSIFIPVENVDVTMFLSIIEATPLLESLSLVTSGSLPRHLVQELQEPQKIITLLYLRSLQINTYRLTLIDIIRHLSYPSTTSVSLDLGSLEDLEIDPDTLADYLASSLPKDLRRLTLNIDPFTCKLSGRGLEDTTTPVSCTVYIWQGESEESMLAFDILASKFITTSLQSLDLFIDFCEYNMYLHEAINEKISSLKDLYISSIFHLPFTLLPFTEVNSDECLYVPAPQLTYLWIYRMEEGDVEALDYILRKRERGWNNA
ncbi:hypothetical protein QCA50_006093 [Cerrena zonata]|uniref:F-box domain-containing protein n=1 Tax=Cerrena zonata TaxID=2478898 RepID=A0AAW0GCD1_9APHY